MARPDRRINLSPLERGVSLSLGALAATESFRRRTVAGALLGVLGGLLIYRGVTGRSHLYRALGISGSDVGSTVSVCSQVTVQLSPTQVYRQTRELSDFHLFSHYVESADELSEDRWRVRLRTPFAGEHDLIVRRTADDQGGRLAWAAVEGSAFPAALSLRFTAATTGTEVHADAWFVPPTPPIVSAAMNRAERSRPLRRAGLAPSQLLEQELRRLRQLLEAGETATVKGQSAGGRRAHRISSADTARRPLTAGKGR